MNELTLYFVDLEAKSEVYTFFGRKVLFNNYTKELDRLCLLELSTLKARIKAIKEIIKCKYNIPIYVNEKMIFFKIKDVHNIWINYVNIKEIKKYDQGFIVFFVNGKTLLIKKRITYVQKIIKRLKKITLYTQK